MCTGKQLMLPVTAKNVYWQTADVTSYSQKCVNETQLNNFIDCNIYAVQQDTQSVLMSKFIQHLC